MSSDHSPEIVATVHLSQEALRLAYKTTCDALRNWPGGDPLEQQFLAESKDQLFSGYGYFSNKEDYFNAADIAGSSACPVNNLYPNNIKNLGTPPFS